MSLMEGVVRRFNRVLAGPAALRLTELESLALAQVEPEGFELSRAGRRFFGGGQAAATGSAPVTAMPTTAADFILWNGEPSGGRLYAMEQVAMVMESGTKAVGAVILGAIVPPQNADITAATGYSTGSANGVRNSSNAIWAENVTLDATPVWFGLAGDSGGAAATVGGIVAELKGRLVIPPTYGLALSIFSGSGTSPLFLAQAMWAEIEASLE